MNDPIGTFEAIRAQTTSALRALTPSGSEEDVTMTRHAHAYSTRFLNAFDALLAEESPELSARCAEGRPAPPDGEELLARAIGLLERADDPSSREIADAMLEDVWRRERLDAPPGAPPPLTSDELERLRGAILGDELDPSEILSGALQFIARSVHGHPEATEHLEDAWTEDRTRFEPFEGVEDGELVRAIAMNFPTWHDAIDSLVFPLTPRRLVEVVCSLDRLAVVDQEEHARTHALAWHRLTRLLLEHYDEEDSGREVWLGKLLIHLSAMRTKLPDLVVLVVTLEVARAGVEGAATYATFLLHGLYASA